MKSSKLRAGAVLACTLALTACGGGDDGQLAIGGSFSGVTKTGLVLTNNGGSDYAVVPTTSGVGNWFFPNLVETDSKYNVEVKSKPDNVETCQVIAPTGRAVFATNRVDVACTFKKHDLGGSVANLKGELVLVNGADKVTIPAGATSFAMAKVPQDGVYGIAILTQPAGQTCTIANASGTMGAAAINNVAVTCTP
ncbi:hypothetical protein [Massilia sp. ST3]|uniref:hypothetical protein n=1 Tax=Massilia sp. ST3 TaxID=2824903 RepID=UPI001B826132|nr:hypothetical protein [Massilia sp. ST3]MBQ5948527.1 hypothetical protein [Massilia sp. ST3]